MEKVANSTNQYRYERKFLISELTKYELEAIIKLHPAMFLEIYHQRYVNNIYFDSFNLQNYFDNVDGSKNRVKVRIRWYDDLFGFIEKPILELKIKDGLVGKKESYPLVPFSIDERIQRDRLVEIFRKSKIPDQLKLDLISMQPTLLNRYSRKYFQSASGKYRITLDSDMEYYVINFLNNTFLHRTVDVYNSVVELKYEPDQDKNVGRITNFFLFRMTRSSKYVDGLEKLNLY